VGGTGSQVPAPFAPTCLHDHTHFYNRNASTTAALGSAYDCLCRGGTASCQFTNAEAESHGGSAAGSSWSPGNNGTSVAREWHTQLPDSSKVWIMGAISGLPIVMFFFFDQNLSSLLTQQPYMHLRRGSFYHSSFLAMGLFNIVGPSFGLPFVTGSLPHSPQMVKALTNYKRNADDTFTAESVSENRIAPFIMCHAQPAQYSARRNFHRITRFD
jgi:hypothetical protein